LADGNRALDWDELTNPHSRDNKVRVTVMAFWTDGTVRGQALAGPPLHAKAIVLSKETLSGDQALALSDPDTVAMLLAKKTEVSFMRVAWRDATGSASGPAATQNVTHIVNNVNGFDYALVIIESLGFRETRQLLKPLDRKGMMTPVTVTHVPSGVCVARLTFVNVDPATWNILEASPEFVYRYEVDPGNSGVFVLNRCGLKPCGDPEEVHRY
jgi:hypothetical protein